MREAKVLDDSSWVTKIECSHEKLLIGASIETTPDEINCALGVY